MCNYETNSCLLVLVLFVLYVLIICCTFVLSTLATQFFVYLFIYTTKINKTMLVAIKMCLNSPQMLYRQTQKSAVSLASKLRAVADAFMKEI